MSALVESKLNPDAAILNEVCKAGDPWSGIVKKGQIFRILDLEIRQSILYFITQTILKSVTALQTPFKDKAKFT
jgi:hypothetical protein